MSCNATIHRSNKIVTSNRGGYTIFLLFIVITVVSILAMSIFQLISDVTSVTAKHAESMSAYYLAEAGLHKALFDIKNILAKPLVVPRRPMEGHPQKVNEDLLELLDIERARRWNRSYVVKDDNIIKGGSFSVYMELLDVASTPFSSFLDPLDKVPPYLEPYHLKRNVEQDRQLGLTPLGGWRGKLRIVVTGTYRRTSRTIESWRSFHVVDVTPPGADYTLFIQSDEREYLKEGRFILSNLSVPGPVRTQILNLAKSVNEVLRLDINKEGEDENSLASVKRLNQKMDELMQKDNVEEALKLVHTLSKSASDRKVKDTLDRLVLSLDPRDWGRVRTNGALFVHLPFFATDDIINYFVDASPMSRRRPEIGFLGCENRLHDPFLSIYTLFEGRIYKVFRRLRPIALGPSIEPQQVPPQRYTINTKMNYPRMRPKTSIPTLLERLKTNVKEYAQWKSNEQRHLIGTKERPIELNGIFLSQKPVHIGGYFTGRGLIVSGGNIHITQSLLPFDKKKDRLGLVTLTGSVRLSPQTNHINLHAAVYAKHSIHGTNGQYLFLEGNLIVEQLKRKSMPRFFICNYNSEIKNHLADNIVGIIARPTIIHRERGRYTPKS